MRSLLEPQAIEFQGLKIEPNIIVDQFYNTKLPYAHWNKVSVFMTDIFFIEDGQIARWCQQNNITGFVCKSFGSLLVVYFENVNDAIRFKLKDPHTLINESEK